MTAKGIIKDYERLPYIEKHSMETEYYNMTDPTRTCSLDKQLISPE